MNASHLAAAGPVLPAPDTDVLLLEEAAALLRLSKATLRELVKRGEVPCRRLGKTWRFSRTALLQLVSGNVASRARR